MAFDIESRSRGRPTRAGGVRGAVIALAVALSTLACSTPDRRTAEERAADQAIAAQVEAALLADQNIYARHIDIDAKGGVVWLTGWVLSADESRAAVQTSAAVPGVRRVVDGVEVKDYFPH